MQALAIITIAPVAIDDTRLTELEPLKDTAAASISPVIWKSLAVVCFVFRKQPQLLRLSN